jgi:glutathionyl-hydroquinone reductase
LSSIAHLAGPVDFDTYGAYGAYRRKAGTPDRPPQGDGEFRRARYRFQGRVSADGSSGFAAEPGRYHLYISWACPWAHRSAIVRRLKKLDDVVSLSAVDPIRDGRGWAFRAGRGNGPDPVNGFAFLSESYEATEPGYDGHVSVPVLWDRQTGQIVSNNFPDITIDLGTQFEAWADTSVRLYPERLRPQIDALNEIVYEKVNNGVYRAGFATTQPAYEQAAYALFDTLGDLEQRLGDSRFLFGDAITEADVRLWVTLARFDLVYVTHFKTNLRRLVDYPSLWAYARDLYQRPAFRETTDFDHIKRHYFLTHPQLNPARIVPIGPELDWEAPHGRGEQR